jgi:hypothetical protein
MASLDSVRVKDPGEVMVLEFDFSFELGATETIDSCWVTAEVEVGYDLTPTNILTAPAQLTTPRVFQQVSGGVDGTVYRVIVSAATNLGKIIILKAIVPVKSL